MLMTRMGTGSQGVAVAEAVDFDGANDYLIRASDLTGNADGKTFTFSAWVLHTGAGTSGHIYSAYGGTARFGIYVTASGALTITGVSSGGSGVLVAETAAGSVPRHTLTHVLVSIDLASTSNRSIYINDVAQSVTWTTYLNTAIDFTRTSHIVGSQSGSGSNLLGRLSHVYLDYVYRDLSNSANRRPFIAADRKPTSKASLAALSPILYLPCDDPATAHVNLGTGGNFTLTGTIARSGRGPNQHNAAYSDLDGSADYLSRTSIASIADGKQFTVAFSCIFDTAGSLTVMKFSSGSTNRFTVAIIGGRLYINAADGTSLTLQFNTTLQLTAGRNYHFAISIDVSSTSKRHFYINNEAVAVTWQTYNDVILDFAIASDPRYAVGYDPATINNYFDGRLGNVFFHPTYIDLSQAANREKFVTGTGIDAKPADLGANGELPFGTSPLIYLPMYGNNAGKNYGTGGDFTVNSGPFTGAKGPNEFWGNKADLNGTSSYLAKTSALTGVPDGKVFCCSFFFTPDASGTAMEVFTISSTDASAAVGLRIIRTASNNLRILGYAPGSGTPHLDATTSAAFLAGGTSSIQICIDLSNTSNRAICVDGSVDSTTWTTYTNTSMRLSGSRVTLGALYSSGYSGFMDGKISEFWFGTSYINFNLESNRLLFRNAFGGPTDLPALIAAGSVPNPAMYMRFDPASFGGNSGGGGGFTPNSVVDGGQL